jgi:NAD(P)-dependent dehydrogenase (short-subunit alcohol dehydrogenase family)
MTGGVFGSIEAARERAAQKSPLGRSIEPEDIAAGFLYLASDDARNQTGQVLVIDGGLTACPSAAPFHSAAPGFVGGASG